MKRCKKCDKKKLCEHPRRIIPKKIMDKFEGYC